MTSFGKKTKTISIGGASGFWGDSSLGATQLVESGQIDYLVFDYLAETTMAILAAMKAKKPELGYATDFIDVAMKAVLPQVMARGIKVVANAGGVNPKGCAAALETLAESMGLSPKIAVIEGDDVSGLYPSILASGTLEMFDAQALPSRVLSANAYLGALPIAQALARGADIVITGRGVDSAVTLGPLIHEFGWRENDFDLLASGSLGGHIIECGCQATGGLFTDWEQVPDWANMGYPIIEVSRDGSFDVVKPANTGGLISRASVAEQLLYEIGDPGAYQLPDVICDFREVKIETVDSQRVRVTGAKGRAPSDFYKVSATALKGYRSTGALVIIGKDAVAKAHRTAQAIVDRCEAIFKQRGLAGFTENAVSLLGAETLYGQHSRTQNSREVWLRLTVSHSQKEALEIFSREIAPAGTSWSPGTTGPNLARPAVAPCIEQFSFTIDKALAPIRISLGDISQLASIPIFGELINSKSTSPVPSPWQDSSEDQVDVPLIDLAWARSGDKGNISNIGVIARKPAWMPLLWARLSPEAVGEYFSHLVKGPTYRFYLPGIEAMNLVMHQALDGGGPQSNRMDPLGKGMAQILLDMPIRVPVSYLKEIKQ
jgi:Acyclic terpene utilisation family protein AtuA